MLKCLDNKLSKGFYSHPRVKKALKSLENVSLNYWAGWYVRKKIAQSEEKGPRWVSELYQCIFLVFGFFAFIFSEWINWKYISCLLIVFFLYRIFEISVFILSWIFVHGEEPLHSYRRSIAGFLLNIVEVTIYFSIITIWSGGLKDSIELNIFYKHILGILTLSPPDIKCTILSLGELFVSALLILVVLGALVGALAREEVSNEEKK